MTMTMTMTMRMTMMMMMMMMMIMLVTIVVTKMMITTTMITINLVSANSNENAPQEYASLTAFSIDSKVQSSLSDNWSVARCQGTASSLKMASTVRCNRYCFIIENAFFHQCLKFLS